MKMKQAYLFSVKAISFVALTFFFISCRDNADSIVFHSERESRFEIISDELYLNLANDIFLHDSCLFLVAYNQTDNTTLQIYDKAGNKLRGAVRYGRGPGETQALMQTHIEGNELVYFFYGKTLRYDISSLAGNHNTPKFSLADVDVPVSADFVCQLDEGAQLVVSGESPRVVLRDSLGNVQSEYDIFPVKDETMARMVSLFSYYEVSHDNSKLVAATSMGVVLEIFSIEEDSIKVASSGNYVEPDFDVIPGSYDFNERTVMGFNDVFATNDRIYAVYDGEVNPYWNDGDRQTFTKIAVFDWEGNPIELIRTDYSIDKICFSEAENTIYAAVKDHDGIMYLAKMEI